MSYKNNNLDESRLISHLGFKVRPNTLDQCIVDTVFTDNEYLLPENMQDISLVVDIGAHIGSFSRAVAERGAKFVLAIEADTNNFELAKINLQQYLDTAQVQLLNAAVWRSDKKENLCVDPDYSCYDGVVNTGGKRVLKDGSDNGLPVLSLDQILTEYDSDKLGKVFVKLDCEGAEWPILYTLKQFERIYAFCGEYHQNPDQYLEIEAAQDDSDSLACTAECLNSFLQGRGFECHFQETDNNGLGLFWAVNKALHTRV